MKPMKLDIQMFATPLPVRLNINFKDITEDELPESLTFSFDGEQAIIQITGISEEYFWTSSNGGNTFDSITIETEGYSITVLQVGDGTGTIYIDVYKNFSFVKKILEDNTINQTTPDFSQVAMTNEGMFADFDNDGISAYFRGAVTNNYVKFANFWWRIIRVNGNGSVRLIYQGDSATGNGQIDTGAFNTNCNDNAHVGYMYGKVGSSTYEATHANVNNSAVKTTLDNWYESNLSNYSNYIDTEVGFWGDRTPYSGSGTGRSATNYAAYNRVVNNKQPTFECSNSSDLYTTSGSSQGNKALQYPIGLISADEVAYAGGVWATSNTSYYLYTNSAYWTMSPFNFAGSRARVFRVYSDGDLSNGNVNSSYGVRPVINLRGDLSVTGTGTSTDPYEVSLPVVPITNFNGVELTNIYYNGTEISKMYCNGTLVFEKGPTVYKRRIMVGDNLKGLTIYNDMKPGYYSVLDKYYPNKPGNENFIIPSVMAIPFSDAKMSSSNGYVYNVQGNMLNFYDYYNGTENITPSATNSNSDYIVSTVVDTNPSYKHLYIEDPYIRPLQVGDRIINGTKLYFIFPDNLYKTFLEAAPEAGPGVQSFINAIYDDGFFIGFRDFTLNNERSITIIVGDDSRRINAYGININFPDDINNRSSYIVDLSNTESTGIVYINPNPYADMGYENLNLNEYILVDTRTLGEVYYRRIIVGDNLRRQTIYADFPAEYYSTFSLNTNSSVSLIKSNELSLINETVLIGSSYTSNAYVSILSPYNDSEISMPDLYNYQNGNENIYNSITMDYSQNFVVTDIVNNASYRHLYLKDLNIRPLQEGDVITENTKIYFTWPDNLNPTNGAGQTDAIINFNVVFHIVYKYDGFNNKFNIEAVSWLSSEEKVVLFDQELDINKSYLDLNEFVEGAAISGTISFEGGTLPIEVLNGILVDTTTLG